MSASPKIDLHTHSRESDGTQSPIELMAAAADAGVTALALTDHDSTAGWAAAAQNLHGVTLIPGIELSTRHRQMSVHILGYLFDPTDAELVAETLRIRSSRANRAQQIVSRLAVDYDLQWDDVLAQTVAGSTIGRPHIADAMIARGIFLDRAQAFESVLHWRSGYVHPHYAPEPLRGIELLVAAGGVPVLAHPATRGRDHVISEDALATLVDAGLFGLEIEHRLNTAEGITRLRELAKKYGLHTFGSSDYHGSGKPNQLGENTTAPDVLHAMLERSTGTEPVWA